MKKVLVTGALQFIGFQLCNELLQDGCEVFAFSSFDADHRLEQEEMELRVGRNALFHIYKSSIEDIEDEKIFSGIDSIFHLENDLNKDESEVQRGLTSVLEKMAPNSKLIYPIYEDETRMSGLSSYVKTEANRLEKKYTILKLPYVYGPWQDGDPSVHKKNSCLYVTDAARAILLANDPQFDQHTVSVHYDNDKAAKREENNIDITPVVSWEEGLASYIEHVKQWQKQKRMYEGRV